MLPSPRERIDWITFQIRMMMEASEMAGGGEEVERGGMGWSGVGGRN